MDMPAWYARPVHDLDQHPGLVPVLVRMLEGRVGSTAMMRLLGTSPEIAFERKYPFESSYLTYLARLVGQLALRPSAPGVMLEIVYQTDERIGPLPFDAHIIEPLALAHRSLAAVWAEFSALLAERSPVPVRYYAEKYWGSAQQLIEAGLRPVVIDLVRDPRDVIASVRAFNRRRSNRLFGRPGAADDSEHFRQLVMGMALRFEQFGQALPVPTAKVRYEDFVTDMSSQAKALGTLLDLHLDPFAVASDTTMLDEHKTSASIESSIGRWKEELLASEVGYIERRLAPFMAQYGYE